MKNEVIVKRQLGSMRAIGGIPDCFDVFRLAERGAKIICYERRRTIKVRQDRKATRSLTEIICTCTWTRRLMQQKKPIFLRLAKVEVLQEVPTRWVLYYEHYWPDDPDEEKQMWATHQGPFLDRSGQTEPQLTFEGYGEVSNAIFNREQLLRWAA